MMESQSDQSSCVSRHSKLLKCGAASAGIAAATLGVGLFITYQTEQENCRDANVSDGGFCALTVKTAIIVFDIIGPIFVGGITFGLTYGLHRLFSSSADNDQRNKDQQDDKPLLSDDNKSRVEDKTTAADPQIVVYNKT